MLGSSAIWKFYVIVSQVPFFEQAFFEKQMRK